MPPPFKPPTPPCPREDCGVAGCPHHCPACGWQPVTEGHDWGCKVLRSYPACRSCYGTGRHPGNVECPNCWGYGRKQLSGPVPSVPPPPARKPRPAPAAAPAGDDALLG